MRSFGREYGLHLASLAATGLGAVQIGNLREEGTSGRRREIACSGSAHHGEESQPAGLGAACLAQREDFAFETVFIPERRIAEPCTWRFQDSYSEARSVLATVSSLAAFPIRGTFFRECFWPFDEIFGFLHLQRCGELGAERFFQRHCKSLRRGFFGGLNRYRRA